MPVRQERVTYRYEGIESREIARQWSTIDRSTAKGGRRNQEGKEVKALVTLAPGRSARRATALAIVGLMLSAGQAFADTSPSDSPTDVAVVSAGRLLDADEIAAADVTNTAKGRAALAAERSAKDSLDVDRRPYRVFEFGGQRLIIDATSPLRVLSGLNAAGKHVFDVTPVAAPPL